MVSVFAVKDIFVGKFAVGQLQRRFGKHDPAFLLQLHLFPAEGEFARAEDQVNEAAAHHDAPETAAQGFAPVGGVVQQGDRRGGEKADDNPADGDLIGNDQVLEIDKNGDDKPGQHDRRNQRQPGGTRSESEPATEKSDAGEQLHEEVANRNRVAAIRAFPAQHQPGDERHVQEPGDGVFALRAMGPGVDHAFLPRHPVDADVQKAPDHRTQDEKNDAPEMEGNLRPEPGIQNGLSIEHHAP